MPCDLRIRQFFQPILITMINNLCLKHFIWLAFLAFLQVISYAQVNCAIQGATVNLNGAVYVSTNNLSIASNGTLNVNNSTVKIAGAVTSSGTLNAVGGTVVMYGSYAQSVPASTFTGNTIKDLVISNSSGVTLKGPLSLTDVLTISSGSLITGGFLTLTSTASATASVAPVVSNAAIPISGNVTVERYVPGRRSYRLITSSVTTSTAAVLNAGEENLSIWGNWQNSANNVTGNTGSIITGGTSADGFDQQTNYPSLYTYNGITRQYVGYTSANGKNTKHTPLTAGTAYYMFIYGDRLNSIGASSPNSTVLKATGVLLTGDQTYNASSPTPLSTVSGRYTLLGNPFASPIDWTKISGTNLSGTYWGWDPNLSSTGGYVTVSKAGSVVLIAPFSGTVGLNQYIQSGQGFFVQTTGSSPTLTIREQDKVTTFNAQAFRTSDALGINDMPLLAINLLFSNGVANVLADGALAAFNDGFSTGIDNADATKLEGNSEGISITNNGQLFSIDCRPAPKARDTLFLNIARLTKPQYIFQIFARQMGTNGMAYLEDMYLHVIRPLSMTDTNNIVFNINPADSASFSVNRFHIVFNSSVTLPVTFTEVSAMPKNSDIQVGWNVAGETGIRQYEVEHAIDGIHFTKIAAVPASNRHATESYSWLDTNAAVGNNYYRIRAIQADGKILISKVIAVKVETASTDIKVFPNPVTDKQITIRINSAEGGQYTLTLYNTIGLQIVKRTVDFHTGLSGKVIYFDKKLPPGFYHLQIEGKNLTYRHAIFVE